MDISLIVQIGPSGRPSYITSKSYLILVQYARTPVVLVQASIQKSMFKGHVIYNISPRLQVLFNPDFK